MRVTINLLMGFKCEIAQMIDEVHTLIGAGAAEGAIDAANILKPALARGELQCIGATTLDEYRKHIEKDPALERRFQPVKMSPLSLETPVVLYLCPTIRQCLDPSCLEYAVNGSCLSAQQEQILVVALPVPCTRPT